MRIDETELALLANPASDLDKVIETMRRVTGVFPENVIDITDPPTPPKARLGALLAAGADPEHAMRELGRLLATRYREAKIASEEARAWQERADREAERRAEYERLAAADRAKARADQAAEDRQMRERLGQLEAELAALKAKGKT